MKWFWSKCRRMERELSFFASGDLEGTARAEVEKHLASCARCSARLRDLQAVVAGCRRFSNELASLEPPISLQRRWRAGIREWPSQQQPMFGPWWTGRRLAWGGLVGLWALSLLLRVTAPDAPKPVVALKPASLQEIRIALAVPESSGDSSRKVNSSDAQTGTNALAPNSGKHIRRPVFTMATCAWKGVQP